MYVSEDTDRCEAECIDDAVAAMATCSICSTGGSARIAELCAQRLESAKMLLARDQGQIAVEDVV